MEGVVLHGTGPRPRLAGYSVGRQDRFRADLRRGRTTTPTLQRLVHGVRAGNQSGHRGGGDAERDAAATRVTAAERPRPIFKTVATEALRVLDVPKDLPDAEPEPVRGGRRRAMPTIWRLPIWELRAPNVLEEERRAECAGERGAQAREAGPKVPNFRARRCAPCWRRRLPRGCRCCRTAAAWPACRCRRRAASCMTENGSACSSRVDPGWSELECATMNLGEILSGVRLERPLAPELAELPVSGLEYDSRRVEEGFLVFRLPRRAGRWPQLRAQARWSAARSRWRANAALRGDFQGALDRGGARPAGPGAGGAQFLRKPDERIALDRHHRHQRQNHHRVSDRFRPARRRPYHGPDRHHRISPGAAACCRRSTPRRNRSICYRLFAELERDGRHARHHGSFLARARAGARVRPALPHRGLHQPDARSPGFSRHHGGLLRGQADAVRGRGAPPPRFAVLNRDDEYARRIKTAAPRRKCSGTGWGGRDAARAAHLLRLPGAALRGAVRQASASPSNRR